MKPLRWCDVCEANVETDEHGNCVNNPPTICGGTYEMRPDRRVLRPLPVHPLVMAIDGERLRLTHKLSLLRATVAGFESTVHAGLPTTEARQAIVQVAVACAELAARIDALDHVRRA